jgi:hypothetical protein
MVLRFNADFQTANRQNVDFQIVKIQISTSQIGKCPQPKLVLFDNHLTVCCMAGSVL